jgi:hypothetical protein
MRSTSVGLCFGDGDVVEVRGGALCVSSDLEPALRRSNIRSAYALVSWLRATPSAYRAASGREHRPYLARVLVALRPVFPRGFLVKRKPRPVTFGARMPPEFLKRFE